MKIRKWEDLKNELKGDLGKDSEKIRKKFHLEDNFVILLTLNDSQRKKLESVLELYPKADSFEENYKMFGVKRYNFRENKIDYYGMRSKGFVEWFTRACGEDSKSNASICFHPEGMSYEEQINLGKEAVLKMAKELERLTIPFETARPPSRYNPK